MQSVLDRKRGCLYGLAIGDALGAAVEFKKPGTFPPVTGYRDGGPWDLNPGEWTDDTAMALALADSLGSGFSLTDQIGRYVDWFYHGRYSVNGRCFDCGNTTKRAITRYYDEGHIPDSSDPKLSGNGSIMRLAPVIIRYAHDDSLSLNAAMSSAVTHGSLECISACQVMAVIIGGLIRGESKETVLSPTYEPLSRIPGLAPKIAEIISGSYRTKDVKGTGYVVESLEAALWAFWKHDSFEETVLAAVNLGRDADTTAAVAGQFAGALYGYSGIPQPLIDGLAKKEMIEQYLSPLLEAEA